MISFSILDVPLHLTYLLVFCTTVSIIIFEYKKQARLFKKGATKRIEGPFQIPVLGNLYQVTKPGRENRMEKYLKLYGQYAHLGLARVWILDLLYIVLFNPEYIEVILLNVKSVGKAEEYRILFDSPLGGGLVSQPDVNVWRTHRKIITPNFHFNVLKTYIPIFYEETMVMINKLQNKFTDPDDKGSSKIIVPDIHPHLQLAAFDMICRSAFGVHLQAQRNDSHSFISAIADANHILQNIMTKPYLIIGSIFSLLGYRTRQERSKKICHEFIEKVIRAKRKEYKRKQKLFVPRYNSNLDESEMKRDTGNYNGYYDSPDIKVNGELCYTKNENIEQAGDDTYKSIYYEKDIGNLVQNESAVYHKSFVELIIENEDNELERMTDEQIRDNMITLMFAGQDTTSTTNAMILIMLALHSEIQKETLEEIDSIFGGPGEDDGHVPTHSEIMQLHTLDRVIKETMRLYPAAPVIARQIASDICLGPYVVPAGARVLITKLALHRDPNLHPRADEFWPDRFLPHNSGLIKNFSYIPFSAGPRNCLGQKYAMLQMKVVMSTILRKFRVSTDESIKCLKDVDRLVDVNITLQLDRCPVVFTPRCSRK